MDTLKLNEIGGRLHAFARVVCMRSTSAWSMNSAPPGKRLILHTIAFWSGSNFARPAPTLMFVRAVLGGTGTLTTTSVADLSASNWAVTFTLNVTLDFPSSCIAGISRNGNFMLSETRYRISSNSPSGGMNVIVRSESNFPRRTQRWKVQSSISTVRRFLSSALCLPLAASRSMFNLSFRANLHSGIPDSCVLITTCPEHSFRRMLPLAPMSRLTDSRTSM
mmetsp:Transcript_68393/g.190079  ORF Transcript_68393/g.190079 Transcript_68393/m.190079 type:complete len:221 (+) Transcript_68393:281-943(+)